MEKNIDYITKLCSSGVKFYMSFDCIYVKRQFYLNELNGKEKNFFGTIDLKNIIMIIYYPIKNI